MFLDASAIVAILGAEDDAESMLAKVKAARSGLFYSSVTVYEAVLSLARKRTRPDGKDAPIPREMIDQAEEFVWRFLREVGAREVAITTDTALQAVAASKTYGRAVGHLAKLNMGDCFAYACSRSLSVPLLFKGNDFPLTDIERA